MLDDVRRHLRAVKDSPGRRLVRRRSRAVPLTWRPGPRSCLTTGSAARRDHLRHRPLWWPLRSLMMPIIWRVFACSPTFTPRAGDLVVPATVVAEVGYLLAREAGVEVESLFFQSLADGDFAAVELTTSDFARMAELVVTYGDLPLGTTDASVIALAERLKLTEIAKLDHRHFTVVRPCARGHAHVVAVATPESTIDCQLASVLVTLGASPGSQRRPIPFGPPRSLQTVSADERLSLLDSLRPGQILDSCLGARGRRFKSAVPTRRSRSEGVPGSYSGPFWIFGSQSGSHLTPDAGQCV